MKIKEQIKPKMIRQVPVGQLLAKYQEIETLQRRGSILADINKNQFNYFMETYGATMKKLIEDLRPINARYYHVENDLIVHGNDGRPMLLEGADVAKYQEEVSPLMGVLVEYKM